MKTIFIVSRKPDFTASRLMEETALMSHGYICCGFYKLYELGDGFPVFVGEMSAEDVLDSVKKKAVPFRVEKVSGTESESCVPSFTDEPLVLYVSARECAE